MGVYVCGLEISSVFVLLFFAAICVSQCVYCGNVTFLPHALIAIVNSKDTYLLLFRVFFCGIYIIYQEKLRPAHDIYRILLHTHTHTKKRHKYTHFTCLNTQNFQLQISTTWCCVSECVLLSLLCGVVYGHSFHLFVLSSCLQKKKKITQNQSNQNKRKRNWYLRSPIENVCGGYVTKINRFKKKQRRRRSISAYTHTHSDCETHVCTRSIDNFDIDCWKLSYADTQTNKHMRSHAFTKYNLVGVFSLVSSHYHSLEYRRISQMSATLITVLF